jgi:hypothetical protein
VISRIVRIAGLLFIGGALCAAIAPGAETDPLAGAKLFRDVESYAGLGVHRTDTAADLKTSEWLRARLEAAGVQMVRQRPREHYCPTFCPRGRGRTTAR